MLERLLAYGWPGNVREMRNVLERALILGRGAPAVSVEHLPGEFRARPGIGDRRHTPLSLEDLERQHIERTLKHHTGNRTRAAIELGISRATLINKIKRYNLTCLRSPWPRSTSTTRWGAAPAAARSAPPRAIPAPTAARSSASSAPSAA